VKPKKDEYPLETEDPEKSLSTEESKELSDVINEIEVESQEQFYLIKFFRGLILALPLSMLCWWLVWVLFF
jgi:hypothetical protein